MVSFLSELALTDGCCWCSRSRWLSSLFQNLSFPCCLQRPKDTMLLLFSSTTVTPCLVWTFGMWRVLFLSKSNIKHEQNTNNFLLIIFLFVRHRFNSKPQKTADWSILLKFWYIWIRLSKCHMKKDSTGFMEMKSLLMLFWSGCVWGCLGFFLKINFFFFFKFGFFYL